MPEQPEIWTVQGLLKYFQTIHTDMPDRSFAFVLGAGASKGSGIPTALELVNRWLRELHLRFNPHKASKSLKEWATPENLEIDDFELARAANFYSQVYDRRFGKDPDEGYADLERIMEGKDPSFGYSVLAHLLAESRHQVVITTNFDDLVTDALFIYTGKRPLVCGHESLAEFIRPKMRRPVIAKLHRDLLLAPQNSPSDTSHLDKRWADAMRVLFRYSSPIFIGYGGNDGSLMGLLKQLNPNETVGRAAWCYYEKDGLPDERICEVVKRLKGFLVPIPGFDEFMLLLNNQLKYPLLAESIKKRADERVEKYHKSVEALQISLAGADTSTDDESETGSDLKLALEETIDRGEDDPNSWRLKASGTTDPEQQEKIYREAIARFPKDPYLRCDFAEFLYKQRRNEEARILFAEIVEENGDNYVALIKAADFMNEVYGSHDEAEHLYRRALVLNSSGGSRVGNIRLF
jgi:tetratricopeptide (TPR) repeat protein